MIYKPVRKYIRILALSALWLRRLLSKYRTFGVRDVFNKNKCYHPDDNVIIWPDDNIHVIIQPDDNIDVII
jgi:Uma2 family endonuclease